MNPVEEFGKMWVCVWAEDECTRHTPGHVYVGEAWRRRYGIPMPTVRIGAADWGDASASLLAPDRMLVSAYDGHSIWEPKQ